MNLNDFLLFLLIYVPAIFLIRFSYVRFKPRFRYGFHYSLFALCALVALLIYFMILANASGLLTFLSDDPVPLQRVFGAYTFIGMMASLGLLVPAVLMTLIFLIMRLAKPTNKPTE